jgi:hypothetical protein
LYDAIRRIDSRDIRVQIGTILKKVQMPPLLFNGIVDTIHLAFVGKLRSSIEIDVEVYALLILLYLADVPRIRYS